MNNVIKFAMAAGTLALVACSGKGSADATLDGDEFAPEVTGTVACDYVEEYEGESNHIFCTNVEASTCKKFGGKAVTSCSASYKSICSVDDLTFFTYDEDTSCEDIEKGYSNFKKHESSSELDRDNDEDDDDDDDGDDYPTSTSEPIDDYCSSYIEICSGSGNTYYSCSTGLYKCSGTSCLTASEMEMMDTCE